MFKKNQQKKKRLKTNKQTNNNSHQDSQTMQRFPAMNPETEMNIQGNIFF